MQAELIDIRNHIQQHAPFDGLPESVLDDIAGSIEIAYFRAGSRILELGQQNTDLHYIRSGAVELYRRSGELYNRLGEGEIFAHTGLLMGMQVRFPATAIEDTLVYLIPQSVFQHLFNTQDAFADYVEVEDQSRLRAAMNRSQQGNELMTSKVSRLINREPVMAASTVRLQEAAHIMTRERVSALPLVEGSGEHEGDLVGIITDRDLRTRAVADALPSETPVADIMSRELITIRADAYIFEAMLTMLHNNVHHLPVMEHGKPRGVIALSDIMKYESQNSLYVVSNIYRQQDVEGLKAVSKDVEASFIRMVHEDANSHMIGSAMAGIGRSFTQRLLELGEEKLGPPPVPYCFLALGSMARDEQLIVTDQDNAMVLDDSFDPKQHDEYFLALARFVSDGLAQCGYAYCTGDIMATNKQWRQPLSVWKDYFTDWIENPKAEALLNSNIFFDLDGVHGDMSYAKALQELIATKAQSSQRFLSMMARNAINRTPPLGFFRQFMLEEGGRQRKTFNLKRRGTAPVSDLIRVHALACGSRRQNSFTRLQDIARTRLLPEDGVGNLRDALEFIAIVRIRHQALAMEDGREPDNNVRPEDLSPFERSHLKDAFQIVSQAQKFLRYRYNANMPR